MIVIVVPGEPVGKGRGRVGRINGQPRVFTPSKTRRYEELLSICARQAMRGNDLMVGPLQIEIEAWFTMPTSMHRKREPREEIWKTTRPDLDNVIKMLDALNGIVWQDDAQVVRIVASKLCARQGGAASLVIRVTEAEEEQKPGYVPPEATADVPVASGWEDQDFSTPF